MRKILVVLTAAALLVAVLVTPALASGRMGGGNPGRGKPPMSKEFSLTGVVAGVDSTSQTITVTVSSGNMLVTPYLDEDVVLQITDNTVIRDADARMGMGTSLTLDDVVVGMTVRASGLFNTATETFTAQQLTLEREFSLMGVVAGVDSTSQTITVTVSSGNMLVAPYLDEDVVLQITDDTIIREAGARTGMWTSLTLDDVTVGMNVRASGLFDAATRTLTAEQLMLNVPENGMR